MDYEEYMQGEPDDKDDILGEYLIEEVDDDDITFISMPKIRYDFDEEFDKYYKILKKCRTKEQMRNILGGIINHTSKVAVFEHEINYLQDRAKDLEFNLQIMQQEG